MDENDTGPGPGSGEGPVILVMGILGLFMQALGPVAWIWGNRALKRAKPSEAGLIQAGRILGVIDTVLLVLAVVGGIAWYMLTVQFYKSYFNDMISTPSPPTLPAVHAPKPAYKPKLPVKVKKPSDEQD